MINLVKFNEEYDETAAFIKRLLNTKNNDYSDTDNVHENFDKQAVIEAVLHINNKRRVGQIISKIITKLIRICNLLFSDKTPNHESVKDSIDDLLGYGFLLKTGIRKEE